MAKPTDLLKPVPKSTVDLRKYLEGTLGRQPTPDEFLDIASYQQDSSGLQPFILLADQYGVETGQEKNRWFYMHNVINDKAEELQKEEQTKYVADEKVRQKKELEENLALLPKGVARKWRRPLIHSVYWALWKSKNRPY